MKSTTKKRNIDEIDRDEELKNANEGGHTRKKMKKPILSKMKSNLPKISEINTSVFEKSKEKKNLANTEKLNTEKCRTISCEDDSNKMTNEQIKDKLKDLKAKEAKRQKRKQSRKDYGQFKVRDTVSAEGIKQKIAEIESRENISKTAKRKLRAFKRKLLDAQENSSSSPSEIPKQTKSQKKKLKREKSSLQTIDKSQLKQEESFEENNLKEEIETSVVLKNVKSKINDAKLLLNKSRGSLKLENKDTLQTTQNSKAFIENEKDSSEEDNDESENLENESEDDSSEESSEVLIEMKESNTSDGENNSSEEDMQENNQTKELENETFNSTRNDIKKSVQKAITKQKKQKNENDTNILRQESTEKKKRYVLFVGNIPFQATVDDIKKHFLQKVSQVISVRIPTIKGSKKPRGFAYVEVTNNVDYEKALSLHHTNLQGFKIKVEYTQTGSKNIKNKQQVVAKNKKLHALRKAGILAGSKKRNNQRNFRRKLEKNQDSGMKDTSN